MTDPHLSERKQKDGSVRLYAVQSDWDKTTKKTKKSLQIYIGCKRADGSYSFNSKTESYLYLLRNTEYERHFYQWQDFMNMSTSDSEEDIAPPANIVSCIDLAGGISLLLDHVAKETAITKILHKVFDSDRAKLLQSLMYYVASRCGAPLYAAATWSESQKIPFGREFSEDAISIILQNVTEGEILSFMKELLKETPRAHRLSLDITSVSSYSKEIPDVMPGYNRDHENLEQINLLMMVDQRTKRPCWIEQLPGAISDITTLKDTIHLLKLLDESPRNIVFDRGFASKENICCLQKNGFKFTMGIPVYRKGFEDVLELLEDLKNKNEFCAPGITGDLFDNYASHSTQGVTRRVKWNGHYVYLHFYYCADYKSSNETGLMERVDEVDRALKSGKQLKHPMDIVIAEKCFTVRKTKNGISVKCDLAAVASLKEECGGYFVLCSNEYKEAHEALYVYKLRDGVEKRFDDLKNEADCARLRMHSPRRMHTRIFIQFLAEILRCYLLERMQTHADKWKALKLTRCRSVNDIIRAMESLRYISIEGHRPFYKRPTRTQYALMKFYDIPTTGTPGWPSLAKVRKQDT